LGLTGNFEPCVMLGRFDKRPRDVWPLPNFDIDRGLRDAWQSIWTKYYSNDFRNVIEFQRHTFELNWDNLKSGL
jgi:hypothetical protein